MSMREPPTEIDMKSLIQQLSKVSNEIYKKTLNQKTGFLMISESTMNRMKELGVAESVFNGMIESGIIIDEQPELTNEPTDTI